LKAPEFERRLDQDVADNARLIATRNRNLEELSGTEIQLDLYTAQSFGYVGPALREAPE